MVKKGQGALEFLMTYGWAFLVILIMIGALAYFGVLSPTKFLPDRCSFGSEITCKDYFINETAGVADVKLRLVNNIGATVNVTNYNASSPDGFICGSAIPYSFIWQPGETVDLYLDGCSKGGVTAGDKFKFDVEVSWFDLKSGEAYPHKTSGEVFRQVE